MRKTLLVVLALTVALVFAGVASAADQGTASGQKNATETKAEVKAEVKHESVYLKIKDLTEKQQADIKAIEKQAAIDADKVTPKEDKQKVWKAADEKIRTTVLTPKQVKELDELEKAAKAKRDKSAASKPAK